MKIKENQSLAVEMLAMGQRPSVVAKSLNITPETISRWQTDEEFKALLRSRHDDTIREIRKEKKYIIDLAFQVLRSTLEDPSIDAVKRAELGLRFLGKIGFDTTLQYSLLNLDDLNLSIYGPTIRLIYKLLSAKL